MDWACQGIDAEEAERFFPLDERPGSPAVVAVVADYCSGCPARRECLSWALATGQDAGVWGGLTSSQRRDLVADAARDRVARRGRERAAQEADGGEPVKRRRPRLPRPSAPCRRCGRLHDLRVSGEPVRHDRLTADGWVPCEPEPAARAERVDTRS